MRLTAALTLAVFFLLGLPLLVSAAEPQAVISEIMWDGVEYIELYNTTLTDIPLAGWSLTRQAAGDIEKTITLFTEEDVIVAGDYFLLEKSETATTIAADRVVSALTLVNTGELVTLRTSDAAVVDQANQVGTWYAGENTTDGVAMERTAVALAGTDANAWHTSTGTVGGRAGTPGQANSEPDLNETPEAALIGPSTALVGQEIDFSAEDSSDGDDDALTFAWSFGDGSAAAAADVAHSYTLAGTYTVRVTVSDGAAEDEAELTLTVTAPVYSNAILINEFLPDPTGSDTTAEFIELKNTGTSSVDLAGWQLDDADGGSTPYALPAAMALAGGAIRSFPRSETKIALNNGGDSVRLLDPADAIKSSFTYTSTVPQGQSYNRQGEGYVLSTTVTAGAENVVTAAAVDEEEEDQEEDSPAGRVAGESVVAVALKDIREEEIGTNVETEGVISAPPGVLGSKVLYLAGSGVQVYFHADQYPALKLGDKVKVRGELATSLGEYRLKLAHASDIAVVGAAEKPTPHQVATGEIDEAMEGSLVIIQGSVTQTSGDTFNVDDGSGEVKVFIKGTTQIDKPSMKKGTDVTITGIVSRTSAGYRVLPRFQEDVRLGRVAGLTSFPATGQIWVWAVVVSAVLIIVARFARRAREPLLAA